MADFRVLTSDTIDDCLALGVRIDNVARASVLLEDHIATTVNRQAEIVRGLSWIGKKCTWH